MIIKVCGVRTAEVAEVAVEAGADWIGIVFEPRSIRHASAVEADAVVAAVGGRAAVIGVLVEPSLRDCEALCSRYRLDALQLHGAVDAMLAARFPVPVIRGINARTPEEALTLQWWPDEPVLLDAAPAGGDGLPGGTGRVGDWEVAAEVQRHRPIVIAGGLGPNNVVDAARCVRPVGVDASSGLESAPGIKEPALVRAYVRAARRVEAAE